MPNSKLEDAVLYEDHKKLKTLIDGGADVNALDPDFGSTALMAAASQENAKAVQLLIEAGADVNILSNEGMSALWNACSGGTKICEKIAVLLIQAGADVNGCPQRPILSVAVQDMSPALVQRLIDEGADVNAFSEADIYPLYMAIICERKKIVEILLANGADSLLTVVEPDEYDEDAVVTEHFGKNMIEVAEMEGYRAIAKLLKAVGGGKSN